MNGPMLYNSKFDYQYWIRIVTEIWNLFLNDKFVSIKIPGQNNKKRIY